MQARSIDSDSFYNPILQTTQNFRDQTLSSISIFLDQYLQHPHSSHHQKQKPTSKSSQIAGDGLHHNAPAHSTEVSFEQETRGIDNRIVAAIRTIGKSPTLPLGVSAGRWTVAYAVPTRAAKNALAISEILWAAGNPSLCHTGESFVCRKQACICRR